MKHLNLNELVDLINTRFLKQYNTRLVGDYSEPFYKASRNSKAAEIQFSHDYIRSALHELSHWCIAGKQRRTKDDYGYWYAEDGRTQIQQDEFFKVEVKPQAIEWAFCLVLGIVFEPSVDNLHGKVQGTEEFSSQLQRQLQIYIQNGFPQRAQKLLELLALHQNIHNLAQFLTNSLNARNN